MEFTAGFTLVGGGTFVAPLPPPPPPYLWSWGINSSGELGLGDTTNRSSPNQIGATITWSKTAAGNSNFAIKTDGTLWAWGYNGLGGAGLGDPTSINRSSPVQVGALTTWSNINTFYYHTLATTTDGKLWAWGKNSQGQLGLGNETNYSSPKQVGALTTWLDVAGGQYWAMAIKTDGTMWSMGNNYGSALGLGGVVTNKSSPTQIGSLTTWSKISGGWLHAMAIKTDGTMWTWGFNQYGRLGLNDTVERSNPTQIGALTTWSSISAGYLHGSAIKTDGTMWSWGYNTNGELGIGDTTNRSSPVQVGALTTWSKINQGGARFHSMAIKTDGSLWAWGAGSVGRLGLGDTTNRSSPVQVGALTTWLNVSANFSDTLAIG